MKYSGYIFKFKVKQSILNNYIARIKYEIASNQAVTSVEIDYSKLLHSEIVSKCSNLLKGKSYAEAVEKSFKVVKDRLREITSYESGSDAFGKGNLYIRGATAPNVDSDFNQAVKFLTMAIDMFRNEKSHTSNAKIDNPIRAYQYLVLSSLAISLLENYEIRKLN